MNVSKIIIGNHYRIKSSIDFGWFKPTRRFEAGKYVDGNGKKVNAIVFEGEHTLDKNDTFGFIKAKLARELCDPEVKP